MIHIIPKPTDTTDDNSTAAVAGEIRSQGGTCELIDIHRIDPFMPPFEHEIVWVCGLTQDEHQFEVLQALSLSNVLVNTPQAIGICASKVFTTALLMHHSVPSPRTLFTSSKEIASRFIQEHGRVVIKPIYGFDGHGIFLIDAPGQLGNPPYYLQEYVPNDRDFRIFVIDGDPVGAIMRVSDTLAHNIHQGGTGIPSEIDDEMRSIAAAAAQVTGVDYGGVDLLRYHDSYCVLEVNGTPNWHCMAAPIPALLARYLLEKERDLKA